MPKLKIKGTPYSDAAAAVIATPKFRAPIPVPGQGLGDYPAMQREDLLNWIGNMPGYSLDQDFKNPSRFINLSDIPDSDKIASMVASTIQGQPAQPVVPKTIGIYGGTQPVNFGGTTSVDPPYQVNLSAHNLLALMQQDKRTNWNRTLPEYRPEANLNPNIDTDPTINAESVLAHELAHYYRYKQGFKSLPDYEWKKQADPNFWQGLKEIVGQWKMPPKPMDDYDRIQTLRNNFKQPFWNSHKGSWMENQAASIVGHEVAGRRLGIEP